MASDATELVIAYRAGERWTQSYQSVKLDAASRSAGLRQQGVYLITGGLGGLGLELAAWLAETVQAKLVLVSRSPLPTKTAWSQWLAQHAEHDPTSEKIRRLQACEAHGGEVLTIAADVTDCAQMQAVLQEVRKRFGALHGVVHAAGTLDDTLMQLKEPDSALGVIAPKVQGHCSWTSFWLGSSSTSSSSAHQSVLCSACRARLTIRLRMLSWMRLLGTGHNAAQVHR